MCKQNVKRLFKDELHPIILPVDDFNLYVNKIWFDDNPIPADEARWGTHIILSKKARENIREILESETEDPELSKAILFFKSGLDIKRIEKEGLTPLQPYFDKIDTIKSREEFLKVFGEFTQEFQLGIFGVYASEDAKDSSIMVPQFYSSGLGLGDRDYYLKEEKKETLGHYREMLVNFLRILEMNHENSNLWADKLIELETQLAEVHYSNVEKRDPHKRYNKFLFSELKTEIPLEWESYLHGFIKSEVKYVIVDNPLFFKKMAELMNEKSIPTWQIFLKVKLLSHAANFLHDELHNVQFNFYGKVLAGMKERKVRWEEVTNEINQSIGELVGKLYVQIYFPPQNKERMLDMVDNLLEIIENRILNLEWMSDETKGKAMLKKKAFRAKIGYPDQWTDYSSLEISKEKSFFENAIAASKFNQLQMMDKFYKLSSNYKHEWFMNPHSVNAYFHPLKNEIVFPAGYLQFPMFDMSSTDAENYGSMGTTIGHEITHSFDDKGSEYDHTGNLNNWWSDEDKAKFKEKTAYFVKDYSNYQIAGQNINGELTLGENIADHGGVKIAYYALQKHFEKIGRPEDLDGHTPEQLFFMAWARKWRLQSTDELVERMMQIGVHSLPEARINVTLANTKEFYDTFGVQEGNGMYRPDLPVLW